MNEKEYLEEMKVNQEQLLSAFKMTIDNSTKALVTICACFCVIMIAVAIMVIGCTKVYFETPYYYPPMEQSVTQEVQQTVGGDQE